MDSKVSLLSVIELRVFVFWGNRSCGCQHQEAVDVRKYALVTTVQLSLLAYCLVFPGWYPALFFTQHIILYKRQWGMGDHQTEVLSSLTRPFFLQWSQALAVSSLLSSATMDGTRAKSAAAFCCKGPNLADISVMWSTSGKKMARTVVLTIPHQAQSRTHCTCAFGVNSDWHSGFCYTCPSGKLQFCWACQKKKALALIEDTFTRTGTDTGTCLKLQANLSILDNDCYTVQLSYI